MEIIVAILLGVFVIISGAVSYLQFLKDTKKGGRT